MRWVVPGEQLYAKAEELARRIIARPPAAVRSAKEAVLRGLDLPLDQALLLDWHLRRRAG